MLNAVIGVSARPDDCALRVHNHGAYAWIGRRLTDALPGQVERLAQETFVSFAIGHSVPWILKLCILVVTS